jgi:hypothetical protein
MNMIQKIGDIEAPIGDLETTVKVLHIFVDDRKCGDLVQVLEFIARHLEDISCRLRTEFDKACNADEPKEGPTLVS